MRAVRCYEGVAAIVDVAPVAGEGIRVKVASAGICGSDLHLQAWNLPVTLGHEMAGFLPDGTAVAVEPMAPSCVADNCPIWLGDSPVRPVLDNAARSLPVSAAVWAALRLAT